MADKTARRDIVSDIKINTKQLKSAITLLKQFDAALKGANEGGASSEEVEKLKKTIAELQKVIENLKKTKKNDADNDKKIAKEQEKIAKEYEREFAKLLKAEENEKKRVEKEKLKAVLEARKAEEKENIRLAKEQSKLEKDQRKSAEELEKQRAKAYQKILIDEEKAIKARAVADEKARKAAEEELRLMNAKILSNDDLRKKNAILVRQRESMAQLTREDIKAYNELTEIIAKNQKKINAENEAIGRHQGSVGDYLKVWSGAPGIIGQAGGAVEGFAGAVEGFKGGPMLAALGAILAVLGTLAKSFMETSGGMALMDKATAYTRAGMDYLRITADGLAKSLKNLTLDKAADGIMELAKAPINDAAGQISRLSQSFGALVSGDFSKAGDKLKDFGKNAWDLSKKYLSPLLGVFGAFIDTSEKAKAKISGLADAHLKLIEAQRNAEYATLGYDKALAELANKKELLYNMTTADNMAFKDDEERFKKATAAAREYTDAQVRRAQMLVNVAQKEVDLGMTTAKSSQEMLESYKKLTAAQIELSNARTEAEIFNQDLAEQIFIRKMDRADADLDTLENSYDAQKGINERLMALETTTATERAALLDYNRQKVIENQAEMEKIIEKTTGKQININELLKISDQKALNEKLIGMGLQERAYLRIIGFLDKIKTWNQDNAEQEKANAVANEAANKKKYDDELALFQKKQELKRLETENAGATQAEMDRLAIEQETALWQAKLSIADQFGIKMAEVDRKILEEHIKNNKKALKNTKDTEKAKTELKWLAAQNGISFITSLVGAESKAGRALVKVQKGMALAKAVFDAKGAVLKAWNSAPFPYNIPAVATTVFSTASLIDAIKGVVVPSENGGGGDAGAVASAPAANVGAPTASAAAEPTLGQLQGLAPRVDQQAVQATASITPQIIPVLAVPDVTAVQGAITRVETTKKGV